MIVQDSQLKYSKEMWRVDIGGKHYCAQTKQLLKSGLKEIGVTVIEPFIETRIVKTRTQELTDILRSRESVLPQKQDALRHLFFLSQSGDAEASLIVASIPEPRSREAKEITEQLGKPDFLFVTYEDITQFVDNIVLRNRLIKELGELYKGI